MDAGRARKRLSARRALQHLQRAGKALRARVRAVVLATRRLGGVFGCPQTALRLEHCSFGPRTFFPRVSAICVASRSSSAFELFALELQGPKTSLRRFPVLAELTEMLAIELHRLERRLQACSGRRLGLSGGAARLPRRRAPRATGLFG